MFQLSRLLCPRARYARMPVHAAAVPRQVLSFLAEWFDPLPQLTKQVI